LTTVNSITNFSPKMTSVSTGRMNLSGEKPPVSAYKKTGVIISKCYNMLCGQCGKRFSSKKLALKLLEIMIVEMTSSPADEFHTVFDTQGYFNSTQSKNFTFLL